MYLPYPQVCRWQNVYDAPVFVPVAVHLLERMLDLDTERRISATQALAHPYLKQYADLQDEPTALPYDQSFENYELSIPEWKRESEPSSVLVSFSLKFCQSFATLKQFQHLREL